MRQLRGWVALATILAFLAGAGLGAILGQLAPAATSGGRNRPEDDAARYVRTFEEKIGFRDEEQRRAIQDAYERYWTSIRALRDDFLRTHQERVVEIERSFDETIRRMLDEEQLRELNRQTRSTGRGGTPDRDGGERRSVK